jgi:hypothetical protein
MRIKMNTTMMHPILGAARPGQIIDLPDDEARPLLEGGKVVETFRGDGVLCESEPAASRVDPPAPGEESAEDFETAAIAGASESAMRRAPAVRSRQ